MIMPEVLAGQTIGQYQVVEKIGEGGMASVYKALQPSLSRYVAIKILSFELAGKDPNFSKRFEVEARAVAALEHPHILPLYDFGAQNGIMYMAMRLVEGGTLATLMLQQPLLPNNQIVKIIGDIAGALDYAHQQGIVHRDIKPSNILIDQHGEVQLTDFGLARVMSAPHDNRLTNSGTVVGTASYMSPEQAADEAVDGRSDIYSLGVILFELLTGYLPFLADTPVATALKHIQAPIPSLKDFNPTVPESFEQIVHRAMAKYPDQRYQTANEMRTALQTAWHELDEPEKEIILPEPRSSEIMPTPSFDALDSEALTANLNGESLTNQAVTAPFNRQSASQTVPLATPSTSPWKNKVWFLIGIGVVVGIIIAPFIWGFIFSSTDSATQPADSSVEVTPFPPAIPSNSLLNTVDNGDELIQILGNREKYYPRQPYTRQYFKGGMMYWWDNPENQVDTIIVVYNTYQTDDGNDWSQHTDTWALEDPNLPGNSCPETDRPEGPVRGFGKLWCRNPELKEALGSPLAREVSGTNTAMEIYEGGTVFSVPADNQIWVLSNDGTWQRFDMKSEPNMVR
jgi:serine/threonine protein kinase